MINYYYFIIWILCWFVGWSFLYHIPKNKRDYIKNYLIVSIYFLIVSFIVINIFKNTLDMMYKNISFFPLIILITFFIINFLTYFFSNKFLKKPIKFLEKYSHLSYLHLDYRYLISKSLEIFFQQVLIISLVFLLKDAGLNLVYTTIIFAFMFGFGHIPMIKLEKGFFGFFVLIASIFASFLFPYLILNFQWGFIYTYIFHWLFYTNSGVLFWIIQSKYYEKSMDQVSEKIKEMPNPITELREKN